MTMDKRFAQGCATSVVQDHWTAEQVEEHLTTARAFNNEQAKLVEELIRAHKRLIEMRNTLDHQLMEMTACTKRPQVVDVSDMRAAPEQGNQGK